jgi:hypothetical protein
MRYFFLRWGASGEGFGGFFILFPTGIFLTNRRSSKKKQSVGSYSRGNTGQLSKTNTVSNEGSKNSEKP